MSRFLFAGPRWEESWTKVDRIGIARYATPDCRRWLTVRGNLLDRRAEDKNHIRSLVKDIYEAFLREKVNYAHEPYSTNSKQQSVRSIADILDHQEGTCLDLSLAFAGVCLAHDLLPVVVLVTGHAFVAVCANTRRDGWHRRPEVSQLCGESESNEDGVLRDANVLLNLVVQGEYLAIECTGFALSKILGGKPDHDCPETKRNEGVPMTFEESLVAGALQLRLAAPPTAKRPFLFAVDVACAHELYGISPYAVPGWPWNRLVRRYRLLITGLMALAILALAFVWNYRTAQDRAERTALQMVSEGTPVGEIKNILDAISPADRDLIAQSLAGTVEQPLRPTTVLSDARLQGTSRAKGAIALAHLGRWESLERILAAQERYDTPDLRAYVLWMLPASNLDAGKLQQRVENAEHPLTRQQLLLALGSYNLDKDETSKLYGFAERLFTNDDDPGVHAAARWILKNRCGKEGAASLDRLECGLAAVGAKRLTGKDPTRRHWFIGSQSCLTMIYIPKGGRFHMGNPFASDNGFGKKLPVGIHIPRAFVVSITELSNDDLKRIDRQASQTADNLNWHQACDFCVQLTKRLTIPNLQNEQCYQDKERNPDHLNRGGFRLPTEAEWEYVARGESTKRYCFGNDHSFLSLYASWSQNRKEMGARFPNSFGLFDVHGGLSEWCDDSWDEPIRPLQAFTDDIGNRNQLPLERVTRGGTHRDVSADQLTVYARNPVNQTSSHHKVGVRLVRTVTFPPDGD